MAVLRPYPKGMRHTAKTTGAMGSTGRLYKVDNCAYSVRPAWPATPSMPESQIA